jgi:hypothetical protein
VLKGPRARGDEAALEKIESGFANVERELAESTERVRAPFLEARPAMQPVSPYWLVDAALAGSAIERCN